MQSLRAPAAGALLVLAGLLSICPGKAEVLAEGQPSGGFYWQKVSGSKGIRYLCRSTSDAKIQKSAKCTAAGAVKPQ